jgi:hypothetical protein
MRHATATEALLATAKEDGHGWSCQHLRHYRNFTRPVSPHHTKKWKAAQEHARRTAPACDCHLRLVYAALAGLGVPYPGGVPEWLDNGPDFQKDEED